MPNVSAIPLSSRLDQQLTELELPVLTDMMDSIPLLSMEACVKELSQPIDTEPNADTTVSEQPLQTLIAETAQSVLEELLHKYTPRLEAELRQRLRERIEQIIQQQLSP